MLPKKTCPHLVACLLILLVIPHSAYSQQQAFLKSLDIVFDIQDDGTVKQTMVFAFASRTNESLEYILDNNAKVAAVAADGEKVDYKVAESSSQKLLQIFPNKPIEKLTVSLLADNAVFKDGPVSHFFVELSVNQDVGAMKARVVLPQGYGLQEGSFLPSSGMADTDGKRIMVRWDKLDAANDLFFSVMFIPLNKKGNLWPFAAILLTFLLVFFYLHFQSKKEEALLLGFFDDEKKAIAYIQQNREILQKDMQREFEFSRAKSTRITKKLESKGLIEKEEFGRTNKIRWKG